MPDLSELMDKYEKLAKRTITVKQSSEKADSVTNKPPAVQEACVLVSTDVPSLAALFRVAYETSGDIVALKANPDLAAEGDLAECRACGIGDTIRAHFKKRGVSENVILPAFLRNLDQQLDMIETIVKRAEANLALMTGA